MTKRMSQKEVKEEAKKLDAAFIEKLSKLNQATPEPSPFDEMAAYQSGRGAHTAPVLEHAIRHIRRVHMNCRTWTLPVGDEQAIALLESLE